MKSFKDLRINVKMQLAFLLVLLMALGVGAFAIVNMRSIEDNYAEVLNETQYRITHVVGQKDEFVNTRILMRAIFYADNTREDLQRIREELEQRRVGYFKELDLFIDAADPAVRDRAREILPLAESYYAEASEAVEILLAADEISLESPEYRAALHKAQSHINHMVAVFAEDFTVKSNGLFDKELDVLRLTTEESEAASNMKIELTLIILAVMAAAVVLIALFLSRIIRVPLNKLVNAARNVANGNLDIMVESTSKDEFGILSESFNSVIEVVNRLVNVINDIRYQYEIEGDIEAKIDIEQFDGAYREVASNVNNLTGGFITDMVNLLHCLAAFGDGNLEVSIPKLPGKKVIMENSINSFRGIINRINNDAIALVREAVSGKLSARVDVSVYKGAWASLADELNNLMDAITTPIKEVSEVMGQISAGNFNNKMKGDYKGEFLYLKESVNATVTNISSYIEEISDVLLKLAQHDLDQHIKREYKGSFSEIKDAFNEIIDTFNKLIGEITSASEQVAAGAKQISDSSMTLATGSSVQAASVEELNATAFVINESTAENAKNAKNAEELAAKSRQNAEKGETDMKNMLLSMDEIKESSGKISSIMKVIDDIAFQTNLLALNATVEAARAGEHGKGFAVVADEVRNLASRSQTAAKETADLIEESNMRVIEGTEIAGQTAAALQTIVGDVGAVADIITGISNSSNEQAIAVDQITAGLTQITSVVQNNSATSEETASASEELSCQAELLQNMVSEFKMKKTAW